MPEKLLAHQKHLSAAREWQASQASREEWQRHLQEIGALLRAAVGHDFTGYKGNTLIRRVQRRMQALHIEGVTAYIAHLERDPHEADLLFRELLIGVTQFFRDPEAFDALATTVFPTLFTDRDPDQPIRIWVPGCATGEEVYSLAILLKEAMAVAKVDFRLQIFGTDLDSNAIAVARTARYRKAEDEVSTDRLGRWFAAEGDVHCPVKEIREMCIFSAHSIIKDPPFSKLDLISCRNVLIYLNSELQHRVIQTFHYSLKPGGSLFLGPSEGVSRDSDLFDLIDKKHRILKRRGNGTRGFIGLRPLDVQAPPTQPPTALPDDSIDRSARRVIESHSPVYFVIDRRHDVVRFSGADTGQYLEPSAGAASLNLFSLLRRTLRPSVRAAVLAVEAERVGRVQQVSVPGPDGRDRTVSLIVEPIEAGLLVVAFHELAPGDSPAVPAADEPGADSQARELRATKAQLKAAVSELEIYMEESKAATEEMQSVNEELQSTNEELETSKEEMQSINEELQSVNAEVENKNSLLTRLNDDLQNLLDSTEIATLFLDRDLRIRKFTPTMTGMFHLREGDVGRPITDIVSQLHYADLVRDAEDVQRTLRVVEIDVTPKDRDATFLLRMRPYRTVDDRLDGVVLTFMDITAIRRAQVTGDQLAAIVQSSSDAIIGKTLDGTITSWNQGAERLFGYTAEEAIGKPITMLIPPDRQAEEGRIIDQVRRGQRVDHYDTVRRRQDGGMVEVSLTVSPIRDASGKVIGASNISHDIGERRRHEENLSIVMRELSHRSKNLLSVMLAMAKQTARVSPSIDSFVYSFSARVEGLAKSHDLLVKQNWNGAALEELVEHQLLAFAAGDAERIEVVGPSLMIKPDAAQTIGLALHELGTNASKHGALSQPTGKVAVQWQLRDADGASRFQMTWREHGGPPVTVPDADGFGRILLERLTAQKFGASAVLTFAPEGVTWTLDAPAVEVLASAATSAPSARQ